MNIKSILTTGTKGKTSVVTIINHLFGKDYPKLMVSSDGVFLKDKLIATYNQSLINFGYSPNVTPGRYVRYNFFRTESEKDFLNKLKFAILESGLTCGRKGTGVEEYTQDGLHDIGIFTNVYEDHINYTTIKDREDIYKMKSFIFEKLKSAGIYIASLDNDYTLKSFSEKTVKDKNLYKIGITQIISNTDDLKLIQAKLDLQDIIYIRSEQILSLRLGLICKLSNFRYYFGRTDGGIIQSLMCAIAACMEYVELKNLKKRIKSFKFKITSGRFIVYQKNDQIVIVDYAHEIQSLRLLIESVNYKFKSKPSVITRVAPDRKDQFIKEFAADLSKLDNIKKLIIYDKIALGVIKNYSWGQRKHGDSATILYDQLQRSRPGFNLQLSWQSEIDTLKSTIAQGEKLIIHIYSDIKNLIKTLKQEGFRRIL